MFEKVSPWGCAWILIALGILYVGFLLALINDFSLDEFISHFAK